MVINALNLMSIDMVLSLFSMHTIDFEEIIIEGSRKNIFVFFPELISSVYAFGRLDWVEQWSRKWSSCIKCFKKQTVNWKQQEKVTLLTTKHMLLFVFPELCKVFFDFIKLYSCYRIFWLEIPHLFEMFPPFSFQTK